MRLFSAMELRFMRLYKALVDARCGIHLNICGMQSDERTARFFTSNSQESLLSLARLLSEMNPFIKPKKQPTKCPEAFHLNLHPLQENYLHIWNQSKQTNLLLNPAEFAKHQRQICNDEEISD